MVAEPARPTAGTEHSGPGGDGDVVLAGSDLTVRLQPGNGADIVAVVDRRTGIDVLFHTPWSGPDPAVPAPVPVDSESTWLARYGGGWQVLCPNAGAARVVAGLEWGFHGEAAIVPWQVRAREAARVELAVDLATAPLSLHRVVSIVGPTLRVEETLQNNGTDPVTPVWMHHPGFGAPLVSGTARLACGARTFVADGSAPGSVLATDGVHEWPIAIDPAGRAVDLRRLPGPDEPRELFGCLTDFDQPYVAIVNPDVDLGVALWWTADVFPHAWLWQEICHSAGPPWHRAAYVVGLEPSNVLPGTGQVGGRRRGGGVRLDPGERRAATLELTVFPPAGDVVGVAAGGRVELAPPTRGARR